MEQYIIKVLFDKYDDRKILNLDGLYLTSAKKTGITVAELYGLAFLLCEPSRTPFFIHLTLDEALSSIVSYRILLGESNSASATKAHPIETLDAPIDDIQWRYSATNEKA